MNHVKNQKDKNFGVCALMGNFNDFSDLFFEPKHPPIQ